MVVPPRRSTNLMVVRVVDSPKLRPCSCEALAFLRESSNRVIITEIYLMHGSDPMVSEVKKCLGVHRISTVLRGKGSVNE